MLVIRRRGSHKSQQRLPGEQILVARSRCLVGPDGWGQGLDIAAERVPAHPDVHSSHRRRFYARAQSSAERREKQGFRNLPLEMPIVCLLARIFSVCSGLMDGFCDAFFFIFFT